MTDYLVIITFLGLNFFIAISFGLLFKKIREENQTINLLHGRINSLENLVGHLTTKTDDTKDREEHGEGLN